MRYEPTKLIAATLAKLFHKILNDPTAETRKLSPQIEHQMNAFLLILSAQQCKHFNKLPLKRRGKKKVYLR